MKREHGPGIRRDLLTVEQVIRKSVHEFRDFVRRHLEAEYQHGVDGEYEVVKRENSEGPADIERCEV
jgi:hypothetical protein